jgi:proteasome lid subunit RPN8/RPN11
MSQASTVAPPVHLPQPLAEEIIAHAREGAPEEICGVMRGRGLAASEVVRGVNVADERIENYTVDPQTLLLQFEFEDAGDEMMGIYHSHPVSEAYPSATDAWNAHYPDAVYFICSLQHDDAPVIRAFRMTTHFLGREHAALVNDLNWYETRPGLFAYFQPVDEALPDALKSVGRDMALPFYVVYFRSEDDPDALELRAVSIVEHPIEPDNAPG